MPTGQSREWVSKACLSAAPMGTCDWLSQGSTVLGAKDTLDRFTLFLVPLAKWSDGTPATSDNH